MRWICKNIQKLHETFCMIKTKKSRILCIVEYIGEIHRIWKTFLFFLAVTGRKVYERTKCIGHHARFKYVMDRLDRESKEKDAIFEKCYINYPGIINRPTRCFILKEGDKSDERKP